MSETPQQHRRRRIRRTVWATSLATFAVAWGVIAGTGAMGHTTPASSAVQQSAQRSDDDGWGFASGDDGGRAAAAQQSQQQLPSMTTRQS